MRFAGSAKIKPGLLDFMKTLQLPEATRFKQLRQIVNDGLAVCFVVGTALREIKERKFYEAEGCKTFAEFCEKEKWTLRYCNQLICDAKTISSLPKEMQELIESEQAARALGRIPEFFRSAIVEKASEGGKKQVTEEAINRAAGKLGPPPRNKSLPPPRAVQAVDDKPEYLPSDPDYPIDATGIKIPKESVDLWMKSEQFDTKSGDYAHGTVNNMLQKLKGIRGRIQAQFNSKDLLFQEWDKLDCDQVVNAIQQAELALWRTVPYAVCHTCQGKSPEGCRTCKGRGFVSQYFWEHFVPEEVKSLRPIIKK